MLPDLDYLQVGPSVARIGALSCGLIPAERSQEYRGCEKAMVA